MSLTFQTPVPRYLASKVYEYPISKFEYNQVFILKIIHVLSLIIPETDYGGEFHHIH